MLQLQLSKKVKRFLVIWYSFNLLALFVNIASVDWKYDSHRISKNSYRSPDCNSPAKIIYFFTNCSSGEFKNNTSSFWPFASFTESRQYYGEGIFKGLDNCYKYFNGVFYKYDFTEFLFYGTLPLIIIGLRRLWK